MTSPHDDDIDYSILDPSGFQNRIMRHLASASSTCTLHLPLVPASALEHALGCTGWRGVAMRCWT
eukprot:6666603-Karenia_brevis.AAC.2